MRKFYRRIKLRRGAKIARVAVMRRLCTIIYQMWKHDLPYVTGGPEAVAKVLAAKEMFAAGEVELCGSGDEARVVLLN